MGGWTAADAASAIAERFVQQVRATPDRVAIAGVEPPLTYAELDDIVDRYAALLADGAACAPVALLLNHGASQVAAALAALKRGVAVVTLNVGEPPARLSELRVATDALHVMTDEEHRELSLAAGFSSDQVLLISAEADSERPTPQLDPDQLAFLICTSGSTGQPKVVMQSHRNVLHNVLRYTNGLGIRADDRIAWLASLSGGQGLVTMLVALLNGATLCPFPIAERGITGLADWLEKEQVTVIDLLPSILRSFARTLPPNRRINAVRLVRLASESAQRSDFEAFRRHFAPECVVASVFGSSETGIVAQALLRPDDQVPDGQLPVGHLAEGLTAKLLDEDGEEVRRGAAGELVVCGKHISPGYWNDERLTSERFQVLDGERCFRTGDRLRQLPDDSFVVVGRADTQVKIRGHRLQLEEVEAALCRQPQVAAAAVSLHTTARGDARLTAHVCPQPGNSISPPRLRRALQAMLPPHAIPTSFSELDSLPMTPTGKIDREKLASLAADDTSADGKRPGSEIERLLAELWSEALEREAIDLDTPFLELGGDSLSAAVIAAGAHELFEVEFKLDAFDAEMTVSRMARKVQRHLEGQASPPPRSRRAASAKQPAHASDPEQPVRIPLTFAQRTMWRQAPAKGAGFNAAAAFRIRGALDVDSLRVALEHIVRRHDVLRTSFVEEEGEPVAIVHPPARLELPLEDLSSQPDAEALAAEVLAREAERPFDLAVAPLLRLRLLRIGPGEHRLVRVVHHIVSDAPSWPIILDELACLYEAKVAGDPPPLPDEPALRFRDYAVSEEAHLDRTSCAYQAEIEWWLGRLDPKPEAIKLPFERLEPVGATEEQTGVIDVELSSGEGAVLDRIGQSCGATYFMTRLAVFWSLLALRTKNLDMAIDTYVTLRQSAELQRLPGPLMNRSILRLRFDEGLTLKETIAAVRAEVTELSAHSWVPYDLLLEELDARSLPRPTLGTKFQAFADMQPMQFAGLVLEPLPRHQVAPWRFTLEVNRMGTGERWRAIFDPRLYWPETLIEFLEQMRTLLVAASAEPELPLKDLYTKTMLGHGDGGSTTCPSPRSSRTAAI